VSQPWQIPVNSIVRVRNIVQESCVNWEYLNLHGARHRVNDCVKNIFVCSFQTAAYAGPLTCSQVKFPYFSKRSFSNFLLTKLLGGHLTQNWCLTWGDDMQAYVKLAVQERKLAISVWTVDYQK
jgi:hypothetical protein